MSRIRRILVLALALAAAAAPAASGAVEGGVTPVARPGSPLAAKRALSLSELRDALGEAMRDVGGASGAYAFDTDARGDGTLYGNDANERRVPASNQKLFTTAAFLGELGARAHLQTRGVRRREAHRGGRLDPRRATW